MGDWGYCIKDCKTCGGIGYIRYDVPIHDENFGKMFPCPNRKFVEWDNTIGIDVEEAKTLDWKSYIQNDAIREMRRAYDNVLERGWGWLYIHGEPGNGKTIMAKSATVYARNVLDIPVKYRKMSEVINHVRSSYDADNGQGLYLKRLEEWSRLKMLVIDEVGRDRQTDFSKQSLSDLMDARYQSSIKKRSITVWVSNFAPSEIFESYLLDRVADGRHFIVHIKGKSVRPMLDDTKTLSKAWWLDY
ncbi:MAG TPA: hypothetical protein DCX03_00310 [Bacteroidales bacterium]|nr:hypothetical protein [Bacteroidales bacterium]